MVSNLQDVIIIFRLSWLDSESDDSMPRFVFSSVRWKHRTKVDRSVKFSTNSSVSSLYRSRRADRTKTTFSFQFDEFSREYEVYFRFHPSAMKCFRLTFVKNSKFRSFMEVKFGKKKNWFFRKKISSWKQKNRKNCSGIGILGDANILTLPVQRIAKYPVLIDQVKTKKNFGFFPIFAFRFAEDFKRNEFRRVEPKDFGEKLRKRQWTSFVDKSSSRRGNKSIKIRLASKTRRFETNLRSKKNVPEKSFSSICFVPTKFFIFDSLTQFGEQRKILHQSSLRSVNSPRKRFFLSGRIFRVFFSVEKENFFLRHFVQWFFTFNALETSDFNEIHQSFQSIFTGTTSSVERRIRRILLDRFDRSPKSLFFSFRFDAKWKFRFSLF